MRQTFGKAHQSPDDLLGEAEGPGTGLALVPGLETQPSTEALLLRPMEAARLLAIGRSKLFEMLARNELPTLRMGRIVRIPHHALVGWVNENVEAECSIRQALRP